MKFVMWWKLKKFFVRMEGLVNFKMPTAEERKRAIGTLGGTNFKVKKALENIGILWMFYSLDKYWIPI